VKVTMTAGKQT